ncbi:hypothetical protein NPIL_490711, partial [Nephila pilipes]
KYQRETRIGILERRFQGEKHQTYDELRRVAKRLAKKDDSGQKAIEINFKKKNY